MKPGFWEFHERDNRDCPACLVPPVSCECGRGLIHTQFARELDVVEAKCPHCAKVGVPEPAVVD
jgi:hypothetical protein